MNNRNNSSQATTLPPVKALTPEWVILRFLDGFQPDDIRAGIRGGADLCALLMENEDSFQARTLRWIARQNAPSLKQFLSPENVLVWLHERRPVLWEAVATEPNGFEWIRWNFGNLCLVLGI